MSVERVRRKSGDAWKVRWREGQHARAKVFSRKADAVAWEAETKRRRQLGDADILEAGRQPLAEFAEEWWRLYAVPNLSRSTLDSYSYLWDAHVLPRLGALPLRELQPLVIERFKSELLNAGVGVESVKRTLTLLQGVLQRAVEWQRLPSNPVRSVRKPSTKRQRAVRPVPPELVEEIRASMLAANRLRDAVLVGLLAYTGLRPGEALALRWDAVRNQTILVERALSLGEFKETKTNRMRTVRMPRAVATDLAEWQLASGRPGEDQLVFPDRDGQAWSESLYRNWRRRAFAPVAEAVGLIGVRPYDLRHTFVSLLIHEGRSVVEIARQAGHSPTMTLDVYGHVFDEVDPDARIPAERRILLARERATSRVRVRNVSESPARRLVEEPAALADRRDASHIVRLPDPYKAFPRSERSTKPSNGLEPLTPSLPWKCSTN